MSQFKYKLGTYVTSKIEKFSGCIVSRSDSLTGCNRYWIQPEAGTDGKFVDGIWTDEHNLEIDTTRQQLRLERTVDQPPG